MQRHQRPWYLGPSACAPHLSRWRENRSGPRTSDRSQPAQKRVVAGFAELQFCRVSCTVRGITILGLLVCVRARLKHLKPSPFKMLCSFLIECRRQLLGLFQGLKLDHRDTSGRARAWLFTVKTILAGQIRDQDRVHALHMEACTFEQGYVWSGSHNFCRVCF